MSMTIPEVPRELLNVVIAAMGSLIAGLAVTLLNARVKERDRQFRKTAEELAMAIKMKAEGARSGDVRGQDINFSMPAADAVPEEAGTSEWSMIESLVRGYHEQALGQAKIQFYFSLIAAVIGFVYIIYASAMSPIGDLKIWFSIAPGIVIDAVAALFFTQAAQTRQRATELYDRLRTDSQTLKATDLVESIEDPTIKSAVKAQLALHLSGLKPKEIDLTSFLTKHP